jgi:hypothetical protein
MARTIWSEHPKELPQLQIRLPVLLPGETIWQGYQMEVDSEDGADDLEDTIVVEQPREVIDLLSPSPEPPGSEDSRLERSPAPSPAVENPDLTSFIARRSPSLSPTLLMIAGDYRPAVGRPSVLGADSMPDFGNAWSLERPDDFMLEG